MADVEIEKRCPVWVKLLLALSLAVNLLIAGAVAGLVLRGGPMGGKGPGMGYAMPYVLALPQDDRRAVFGAVRRDPDLPGRAARRAAYDEMVAVLGADRFDPAAAEAVLNSQAEGVAQVQMVARAAWLDRVNAMSVTERQAYAQRVGEVASKRRGKPQGPKPRDE